MSITTQPTPAPARYGGWHKVTSPGIGPLGLAGTIAGISGLVLAFFSAPWPARWPGWCWRC